jgi:hypothetical protein
MAVFAAMAAVGLLGAALPLSAQDANADLKKEVDELREEVRSLRKEAPVSTPVSVDPVAEPRLTLDGESPLLTALKESKLSGFVDTGLQFNLNNPLSDNNVTRGFDTQDHGFLLHQAQLLLERTATKDFIAGYRIRLAFGEDAEVMNALFGSSGLAALEEGYVQILANVGNGIDIKVGRFVTLAGFEVIESKDNMNYSRSNLFTWAIPFAHTGIRASYPFGDTVKVTVGVNNGWDSYSDINDQMALELQLALTFDKLSAYATVYYGAEQAGDIDDKRFLLDLVATLTLDNLTLGVNIDIGQEDFEDTPIAGEDSDAWFGWAVYAKYAFNEKWSIALRVDGLSNDEGSRFLGTLNPVFVAGTEQTLLSVTATLEHRPISALILRMEVRLDTSDEEIYDDSDGAAEDSQATVAWEAIFVF